MSFKKRIILSLISIFLISIPLISNAAIPVLENGEAFADLNSTAGGSGYMVSENPDDIILIRMNVTRTVVKYVLSLLGIIFLILVIVGGYQWMTAGGNEETIAKAKKRIINATIGVAIVLMAYVITDFIFTSLVNQTIQT